MQRGKLANHYTNGITLKKHYCIDCNRKISCYSKRCVKCALKELWKRRKSTKWHPKNFKGGFTYCIECDKQTHSWTAKRCASCASRIKAKNSWKKVGFRKKMIQILINNQQKIIKIIHNSPNLIEKQLQKIIPSNFKFVGNGTMMINRFNPDFIDLKNKKIIELFGDYWHNREDYKIRDKKRIKTYKKYGYKTLIIWEHELKDINKVIIKLTKFNQKKTLA